MKTTRLIILGLGGVGRSLLEQILEFRPYHAQRYQLRLEPCVLCDSGACLARPQASLTEKQLRQALSLKQSGGALAEFPGASPSGQPLASVIHLAEAGWVVVDCTASSAIADPLLKALSQGAGVVLANKKPLTADQETYDHLTRPRSGSGLPGSRWETTVGAGVPVIASLNRLMASGDQVERIEGAVSGTLGRLMTGLQQGRPFSEVIRQAHREGATEPDPRDDLAGQDAARKALILARGMGLKLAMEDVEVESLFPEEMSGGSVDAFLEALPRLDETYRQRCEEAARVGQALRYSLEVSPQRVRVGCVEVALESPLGRLQGADNLIQFATRCFSPTPLVLQGRGAGVRATASGVLGDILEVA